MKRCQVIIGANYGDEGKGLMTDFFASRNPDRSLVVRFNGGAQAGHTVVAPDGRRHVFSHFGAGSFVGATTYLSHYFIVNPLLFKKELSELDALRVSPRVLIDDKCFVTTPFDVFINQLKEVQRGSGRHGSCGAGINETVTRSLRDPANLLRAHELHNAGKLRKRLHQLSETWLPSRMSELGLDTSTADAQCFLSNLDVIMESYVEDTRYLVHRASIIGAPPKCDYAIFEGAQGLMLDEDRIDQYPHVTRSKTGLFNALRVAAGMGIRDLDLTYVTRTYLTRHGAGPLPGERDWSFADNTNVTNKFQGQLRFAPLDFAELNRSITMDIATTAPCPIRVDANIAVTWCDQLPAPDPSELCLPIKYMSHGPCRNDVTALLTPSRTYRKLCCLSDRLRRSLAPQTNLRRHACA